MKFHVILGSTRQGRFSEQPGKWILQQLQQKGIDAELIDLRDFPLPFFNEPMSPAMTTTPYTDPAVLTWTKKVAEADAYIIITPEYNHGYSAVLKNALDYVYKEWNNKPVAFVSYGGIAAGTRAVQQLKEVALELQMHPIRNNIHISLYWERLDQKGQYDFSSHAKQAEHLIEQLTLWSKHLKNLRQEIEK